MLASSCATGERPTLAPDTTPPQGSTTLAESTDDVETDDGAGGSVGDTQSPSAQLGAEPEPPVETARAAITPTGVIVPVLGVEDGRYLIRTPCGLDGTIGLGIPIETVRIVLDPGHGGDIETGAVGANGLQEKDLNLAVAERTARELNARGISTILTRTADYRIPLAVRAEIGNQLGAEGMISIHHNAPNWEPSEIPGTEVFIQTGSPESRRLGGLIWEETVAGLSQFDVEWTTNDDAGALRVINDRDEDSYGMIRRPEMPAVLAELGYISNPPEAELFATDEYVEVASIALANAVERWLETPDPGAGFVDVPRIFTPSGATGGADGCLDPDLE